MSLSTDWCLKSYLIGSVQSSDTVSTLIGSMVGGVAHRHIWPFRRLPQISVQDYLSLLLQCFCNSPRITSKTSKEWLEMWKLFILSGSADLKQIIDGQNVQHLCSYPEIFERHSLNAVLLLQCLQWKHLSINILLLFLQLLCCFKTALEW